MSSELKFHPLADLIPPMTDEEYATLAADIKANGLHEPITLFEGMVLDGCHRYRACMEGQVEPKFETYTGDDPLGFVISKNIHRRHLTTEKKREVIAKLLKAQPEKSDRAIAEQVKADKNVVSRIRRKAEATGAVAPVEKRTGKDGKARKQPARKLSKRQPEVEEQNRAIVAEWKNRLKDSEAKAKIVAAKLIALDHDLAREILHLQRAGAWFLTDALAGVLDDGVAADDPAVSAEVMKAKFAAMDDAPAPEASLKPSSALPRSTER
jgi:ParB-like chromosome segregation protein Spo0J